jgi:hypothetical protein
MGKVALHNDGMIEIDAPDAETPGLSLMIQCFNHLAKMQRRKS